MDMDIDQMIFIETWTACPGPNKGKTRRLPREVICFNLYIYI
jgi:hypothetical protein